MRLWGDSENPTNHFAISKKFEIYKNGRRSKLSTLKFAISCFKVAFLKPAIIEADQMPSLNILVLWVVAKICRAELTVTWNEVWDRDYWVKYAGPLGNLGFAIDKLSLCLPDQIFSVSEFTRTRLINLGINPERITDLDHDLDVERIRTSQTELAGADVMFAGRLLNHKRVDVLIRSISILKTWGKECNLIIVGEGPELDSLKQLTRDLLIVKQVSFYPFFANKETLWGLMNKTRIFDSPSEREGYGIAVSEALAAGMHVIVVDAPDNASKIQIKGKSNGTLLPNNDPTNHAKSILDTLLKKEILDYPLNGILQKPEIHVPKKSREAMVDIYLATWKQICR
jgi:glycosyltransferase involved in cell wall biosynthesis